WHAVTARAALEAPRTFRNSRRLTPVAPVGEGSWLMSVVAVRAIVPCLLSFGRRHGRRRRRRRERRGRRLRRRVAARLEAFLGAVAVDVTAHAPAHVQRRVLVDTIHLLHLAVAGLAGDADVDVARV